jgi:RimJ/RimL family protein N-acetyltransferase
MDVQRYDDPVAFRRDATPMLMRSPGRNSLPLAVIQTLVGQPDIYPDFHLWLAVNDGVHVGLAMLTEPHNVIVADPIDPLALAPLARAVLSDGAATPGVIGNVPYAEEFARFIADGTGRKVERILSEGVWELTDVNDVPEISGSARPAMARDRDLIRSWLTAFAEEALPPEHPRDDDRTEANIDHRLAGHGGGFWLWEDGEPVSLSGHYDLPGTGSRIGPVYTPPELRSRGYATRLVAELSAARLAMGDPACFLFTDLANPISNAIYERIGYVKLCDAEEYVFRD